MFILQYDAKRISQMSKRLVDRIMAECSHVVRNGDQDHMYPGKSFVSRCKFPGKH